MLRLPVAPTAQSCYNCRKRNLSLIYPPVDRLKEQMAKKKRKPPRNKKVAASDRLMSLWQSIRFPLLLIVLAFVPRLLVCWELSDSPLFSHPVIDSKVYHQRAVEIAAGDMPRAHHYRGIALLSLRKNREAAQAFRAALQADPTFTPARNELQKLDM